MNHVLAGVLVLLGAGTTASADEFTLRDGRVLFGRATRVGDLMRIDTREGIVEVSAQDVVRQRSDDELEAELDAVAAQSSHDAFALLETAMIARRFGLVDRMWKTLDLTIPIAEKGSATERRLHEVLASLEPELLPAKWRRADTDTRVRELLQRLRPGDSVARRTAVVRVLAHEPKAEPSLQRRIQWGSALQRLAVLQALSLRPGSDNERLVSRSAVLDADPNNRAAIADLIREHDRAAAATDYLASGLLHPHPEVRIRVGQALARLQAPAAVDHLVAAGPMAGKVAPADAAGASRGNIAILQQTSFVRDFDVEVAQASFIADPKVDVLQSGAVLDATVHAVTAFREDIVTAWRRALRDLTGSDPGRDPQHWAQWRDARRETQSR